MNFRRLDLVAAIEGFNADVLETSALQREADMLVRPGWREVIGDSAAEPDGDAKKIRGGAKGLVGFAQPVVVNSYQQESVNVHRSTFR